MAASSKLAVLVVAAVFGQGCTPVCDEAGLRRAAEAFAAAPGQRQAGVEALRGACPALPPALASGLVGDVPPAKEPAWQSLFARTCPDVAHAKQGKAKVDDLRREGRKLCGLDRDGLLEPGDVFRRDDLVVFMLLDWLIDGRVERSLAMDVARPLLTGSAFAAWGVTPPRGKIDAAPRLVGPAIRVSATEVAVDDVPVVSLAAGRPAVGAFSEHVSPPLQAALAGSAGRARVQADRGERAWDETAVVLADRATPFSTLADVVFTASKAGFNSFELVVHDGEELGGQHFGVPYQWFPLDGGIYERPLEFMFVVGPEVVVARMQGDPEQRFTQPAGAAIAAYVARTKKLYPGGVVAWFRVDGEVSLQAVVSLIDTVSGETCKIGKALRGEKVPDDCLFWQPVLDLEPPLPIAAGHRPSR